MALVRHFRVKYAHCAIIIFPLVTFFLCLSENSDDYDAKVFDEIKSSINDYPLTNLTHSNCSDDQYKTTIYTWPGTDLGCTCANIEYYIYDQYNKYIVFHGTCDRNQTRNGCGKVDEVSQREFNKWGDGYFCSKKFDYYDEDHKYLNLLKNSVKEGENCASGYKKCGKLDNLGNILCLPESEDCPVNDFIISDSERSDLPDYEYFKRGNRYVYYTNKKTDNQIYTKLKVVEGKLCTHKSYVHTDFPQYILDKNFGNYGCKEQIGGKYYDTDILELDSVKKRELFEFESLNLENLYKDNAEFPFQSLVAKMVLYPKKYIGFDYSCLQKNNFTDSDKFSERFIQKMTSLMKPVRKCVNVITWFAIIGAVLLIIDSIILAVYEFKINDDAYCYITFYIWTVLSFLFYLGMIIPAHINLSDINSFETFPECGDSITNEKIAYFNHFAKTYKTIGIVKLFFIHGQLIFTIIYFVLKILFHFEYPSSSSSGSYPNTNSEKFVPQNSEEYKPEYSSAQPQPQPAPANAEQYNYPGADDI